VNRTAKNLLRKAAALSALNKGEMEQATAVTAADLDRWKRRQHDVEQLLAGLANMARER
jgi:DNA invertase Pin-like site-specific DNA recombinase